MTAGLLQYTIYVLSCQSNIQRAILERGLSSNTPHCTPLECGTLDMSHSIDISILWIEERDSDQKVLLAERINPTGIMACYQVTLA